MVNCKYSENMSVFLMYDSKEAKSKKEKQKSKKEKKIKKQ